MNRRHWSLLAAGTLLLGACSSLPEGVLSEEQMADVMADLDMADAYYAVEGVPGQGRSGYVENDSVKKIMLQSVLKDHGLTRAQFEKNLDWYGHHLDRYENVCDLTLEKLKKNKAEFAAQAGQSQVVGESLWKGAISQRLSGGTGRRQLAFTLPSAGLDKGARMIWSFHITSITTPVEVLMAVDYSDGSTALLERQLMSEGRQEIALQTDSTRKPQLVYGYLRAPQSSQLLLDSITLTSQPLNRINYYDIHSQKQLK